MKEFAVIGCGRFGSSLASTLYHLGHEVVAIDFDEEKIQDVSDFVTYAVQVDVTDEMALKDIGLSNFDTVVVSMSSNYQASIMATLIAKELGVKTVIAKAKDELHGKVLEKIGADKVIYPEQDMGVRVAHSLTSSNILDFIELSPEYGVVEITALEDWENKNLKQIDLSKNYGINVVAIKSSRNINISPSGSDIIRNGDILVIIGSTEDLTVIEELTDE